MRHGKFVRFFGCSLAVYYPVLCPVSVKWLKRHSDICFERAERLDLRHIHTYWICKNFMYFFAVKKLTDHVPLLPSVQKPPFLSHLCCSLLPSQSIFILFNFNPSSDRNQPARRWLSYHHSSLPVPPSRTPRHLLSPHSKCLFFPTNVGQSVRKLTSAHPGCQMPPKELHLQALESSTWDITEMRGCVNVYVCVGGVSPHSKLTSHWSS